VCFGFARLATACGISPAASELWCSGHLVIFYRLPSSEAGSLDADLILRFAAASVKPKANIYNDLRRFNGTAQAADSAKFR
jgi:hypothetical protein